MVNSQVTYYINDGSTYKMTDNKSLRMETKLPPGHYALMLSMEGLYLQSIPVLEYSGRIYGDVEAKANRIIATYFDRSHNTGILLEGEKGSGKTLLIRILAQKLLDLGISTIVVNMPIYGDSFNKFISDIQQPAMIVFDEFEKVYPADKQEQLLTLFDGLYHSKKLFAVSINDYNKLLHHLKNRPGRMYYHLRYSTLDEATIAQYIKENLKDKSLHDNTIASILGVFDSINFDMLKALVEEMNRYGEPLRDVCDYVNASPSIISASYTIIGIKSKDDKECMPQGIDQLESITLSASFTVSFASWSTKGETLSEDEKEAIRQKVLKDTTLTNREFSSITERTVTVSPRHLVSLKNGVRTFNIDSEFEIQIKKNSRRSVYSWKDAL